MTGRKGLGLGGRGGGEGMEEIEGGKTVNKINSVRK